MIRPFGFGKLLNYLEILKVNSERCVKTKSPLSRCNLCANVCPEKGLSFQKGTWEVSACSLCGRCVSLCPCEVFSMYEKKLLEESPSRHLVLTCQKDKSTNFGLKLTCFKALSPEILFYLLKRHEKVSLVVSSEVCQACENEYSTEVLSLLLSRYHINRDRLFLISDKEEVKSFEGRLESSRRAYLTGSYKRLLNQGADAALEEMADRDFAQKDNLPLRRALLYQAYKEEKTGDNLPYPLMKINHCHFCGACEKLCPEEALKIIEKEDKKYLLFQPVLCNFCKLCEDICMAKGISWGEYLTKESFFSGQWQVVSKAEEVLCKSCGRAHHSHEGDELCYFCKQRQ